MSTVSTSHPSTGTDTGTTIGFTKRSNGRRRSRSSRKRGLAVTRSHSPERSTGPFSPLWTAQRVALKVAKIDVGGVLSQFYEMSLSQDLASFKNAIEPMNLTYNNIAYAGSDGQIFYVYGGAIPNRNDNFDWKQPVDGRTTETDWRGYHTLAELPQIENPASGFIQNSNSTPFQTTEGANPESERFPAYMASQETDTAIARRSRQLLSQAQSLTLDQLAELAFDTYVPLADYVVPAIIAEYDALRVADAVSAQRFEQAVSLIEGWDRRTSNDSVPSTLVLGVLYAEQDAGDYPLLAALTQVMSALEESSGTWRVGLGEINRLQRQLGSDSPADREEGNSLPSSGMPFWTGAIFTFNTTAIPDSMQQYGQHGHSFVSVIEFSDPVDARSVMAFGQSRDPQSPHFEDQATLYSRRQFKSSWFAEADVLQHSQRSYHPGETGYGNSP